MIIQPQNNITPCSHGVLKIQERKIYPGPFRITINTDLTITLVSSGNSLLLVYVKAADVMRTEFYNFNLNR